MKTNPYLMIYYRVQYKNKNSSLKINAKKNELKIFMRSHSFEDFLLKFFLLKIYKRSALICQNISLKSFFLRSFWIIWMIFKISILTTNTFILCFRVQERATLFCLIRIFFYSSCMIPSRSIKGYLFSHPLEHLVQDLHFFVS